MVVAPGVTRTVNARIAAIDELLSHQLNEILHHPEFQKLEGVVAQPAPARHGHRDRREPEDPGAQRAARRSCCGTSRRRAEFTESALWKKVYEDEFGLYGGDPFGALVGDYEFDKGPQDIELLTHMSQVAAAAHAPFISAAAPQMFGMERFTQMPDPAGHREDLRQEQPREHQVAVVPRFGGLALRGADACRTCWRRLPYGRGQPRRGLRLPGGRSTASTTTTCGATRPTTIAGRLTGAFAKHHWCVAIRGPEGGGLVEDLPIHIFKTARGRRGLEVPDRGADPRHPGEGALGPRASSALLNCKNTDYAAFFGGNSIQRPKKYDTTEATANAKLSSQLPYLMATSRIAHYLKAICRDKIGSFMSRSECEKFLNNWIMNYVLDLDDGDARRRRRSARCGRRGSTWSTTRRGPAATGGRAPAAALPAGRAGHLAATGGRSSAGGAVGERLLPVGGEAAPWGARDEGLGREAAGAGFGVGRHLTRRTHDCAGTLSGRAPRRGDRGADSRGQVPPYGRGPAVPPVHAAELRGRVRARRGPPRGGEPRPTEPQDRIGCLSQPARGRVRASEGVPRGLAPRAPPDPPRTAELRLQALAALRAGDAEAAEAALEQAAEESVALRGKLNGEAFGGLRDYDDVLGQILEIYAGGRCLWMPLEQIRKLEVAEPRNSLDLLWAKAELEDASGTQASVHLPVLYEGSCDHPDERVRLGRSTEWIDCRDVAFRGAGQKVLLTARGEQERQTAILELRILEIEGGPADDATG